MDRRFAPEINPITNFSITRAKKLDLPNGIPFYYINSGTGDLIKIEWMFAAGNWYQSEPLIAFAVNNMLVEGTVNYASAHIIRSIEYYGASIGYSIDKDNAFVSVIVMRKHLAQVLPLMEELIKNAIFPENELELFKQKHKQQYFIEQSKLNTLARTNHSQLLFGDNHPYGYKIKSTDFDAISRPAILDFYKNYYHSLNCKIIASGKIDETDIQSISAYFGNTSWGTTKINIAPVFPSITNGGQKMFIEKADAVQNAIRIGKVVFNKTHSDYAAMSVLNCILGGYFGSRLMKKIREEKGYTYGINSLYVSLVRGGFLVIVSEVGSDNTRDALTDIYTEIELLRCELVPDEELQRVKNYMMGELVRMFDGPFAQAENLISLLEYDMDYEHFSEIIQSIKEITPAHIRALAYEHLNPESMSEVVVGKTF
jgi:predicted Zn-dependent peptidase